MILVLLKIISWLSQEADLNISDQNSMYRRRLCYSSCNNCSGGSTSFLGCFQWSAAYYEYYIPSDPQIYCTEICPTGYQDAGTQCFWLGGSTLFLLSYNFNKPSSTFTNQGNAGASFDATSTIVGQSGYPAKNRGLHFDGSTSGYVEIYDDLYLSVTFCVHSWVLMSQIALMTLFWRDRSWQFNLNEHNWLDVGVDAAGLLYANQPLDANPSIFWSSSSVTAMTTNTWTYLVYSYDIQGGENTIHALYINNVQDYFQTCNGFFHIDSSCENFIGLRRTNDSPNTFDQQWDGFIYDFHMYQEAHDVSNTAHATSCSTGWATWTFLEYSAGNSCRAGCTGWVGDRFCPSPASQCSDGFQYCHLCADVECQNWYGYGVGECNASKWFAGQSTEAGGECTCDSGIARADINLYWDTCHPDCSACDFSSTTTYQGCQACSTGQGVQYNTSYFYCADFCPTPQTLNVNTCVGTLGDVFEAKFTGFASTWTFNAITLDSQGTTRPSKNRGQYFQLISSQYMEFTNDFFLNLDFTISSWIRLDAINLGLQQCIFSVTDGEPVEQWLFKLCVENTGLLEVVIHDASTGTDSQALSSFSLSAQTWYFIAASITLDSNATTSTVNFKMNGNADDIQSWADYFIESTASVIYKKYVGTSQGGTGPTVYHFGGFIFGIWIENVAQSGNRVQYLDPISWNSCTLWATVDAECLGDYEFTEYETGTCDAGTCTNLGCVRSAACQTCVFAYCHLWYDIECEACSGYTAADCTLCSANSQSDGAGGCTCINGYDRQTTGDKNTNCIQQSSSSSSCTDFTFNGSCVTACPSPGYFSDTANVCTQCPSSCNNCQSSTLCTYCDQSYVLRDDGLCYTSCPVGTYAHESGEWYDCFGTWSACTGGRYDQCSIWAPGIDPLDSTAAETACDCSNTANTSKSVKFACIDQAEVVQTGTTFILAHLDSITNSESLNNSDFEKFVWTGDNLSLVSASQQREAIRVLNSAGQKTITEQSSVEQEVSTNKFFAKLKADQVQDLQGVKVLTSTGSGVQIPVNLISEDVIAIDSVLAVQVIQMKGNENQKVLGLNGYDVVSAEVYEIFQNRTSRMVQFEDLAFNFTIIFEGQQFNTSIAHECVHYTNGNWTNSGCWLSVFDSWRAECSCNHLTEFSMRQIGEEAAPESNIAATVNFASVTELDENTNYIPMIIVSSIVAIYISLFLYLYHKDRIRRRQGVNNTTTSADKIHEFALQIMAQQEAGEFSDSSNSSFSSSMSSTPNNMAPTSDRDMVQPIGKLYPGDELFETVDNAESKMKHEMSFTISYDGDMQVNEISQEINPTVENHNEGDAQDTQSSQSPCETQMASAMAQETMTAQLNYKNQVEFETAQDDSPRGSPKQISTEPIARRQFESNLIVTSTFRNRFLEEHPLIGVFSHYEKQITRKERLTVLYLIIMLTIFSTGLFYGEEAEEEEEEEKSATESWQEMRLRDLLIIMYSTLITIPIPLIMKFLFRRKPLDPEKDYNSQMRCRKIKRTIAFIITVCLTVWIMWSVFAFSIDFGYNKSQKWMFSFLIAEIFDVVLKDNVVTIIIVAAIICIAFIKERREMAKKRRKTATN